MCVGGGGRGGRSDGMGMGEKVIFISFPSHHFLLVLCGTVHKKLVSTMVH